jgi:hypothetical protein
LFACFTLWCCCACAAGLLHSQLMHPHGLFHCASCLLVLRCVVAVLVRLVCFTVPPLLVCFIVCPLLALPSVVASQRLVRFIISC